MYLTGNSQVTFFKLVYRRHTNFSQETIEQTFNGAADFGKKVSCLLSRNGDLVHKVWLYVELPPVTVPVPASGTNKFRWLNHLGHVLIRSVEFEIGGQRIDKQYGEWMHIYSELSMKSGHQQGYANMIGNVPKLTNMVEVSSTDTAPKTVPGTTLYVPLQFYFNRNPGLCVPLVALQYHEVKINVEFRQMSDCCYYENFTPNISLGSGQSSLLVDYIYLDSDERRRFASVSHEYLVTQLQFTGDESTSTSSNKFKLAFNHPTKEIVWVTVKDQHTDGSLPTGKQWFNFTTKPDLAYLTGTPMDPLGGGIGGGSSSFADTAAIEALKTGDSYDLSHLDSVGENPTLNAKLQLNGHDRFAERDGRWFNLCVPYACHENIPATGINVYNFALKPEEHQPSGSLNMSRVDMCTLHLNLAQEAVHGGCRVKIYAVSYNVLRVMAGMAGLAYSN